ncbi:uncharacterized protein LOC141588395 [Silene latifolia]|uniref:uncharacterized protein LOC141588395 n=1 Tax=Silene latifolia TaxID=37657 RepID=UPI003D77129C
MFGGLLKNDHLWIRWVNYVYMKNTSWTDYIAPSDCSWSWKKIVLIMSFFKQAYVNHKWLNSSNQYTVKAGYDWLRGSHPKVTWYYVCWNRLNLPKFSFICWEFMHKRLPTRDRLIRMGCAIDPVCSTCCQADETHSHLVCECPYAIECFRLLHCRLHTDLRVHELIHWFSTVRRISKFQKRFIGACHVALIYWLWRVRNEAKMNAVVRRHEVLVLQILHDIKARVLALNTAPLLPRDYTWLQNL